MVGVVGSNPIVPTKFIERSPSAAFCVLAQVLLIRLHFLPVNPIGLDG